MTLTPIDWWSAPGTSKAQGTVTTSCGSPAWHGVFSAGQVKRAPSFFRRVIATERRLCRWCNRWPNATSPTGGSRLVPTGSGKSLTSGEIDRIPPLNTASRSDCSIEHSDGWRMPVDCDHATHIHESNGFCRMDKCAGRNRVFRKFHVFGTPPSGRLGRSRSTRVDVVLETSGADHVAKHSRRAALSTVVGCRSPQDGRTTLQFD